MSEWVKAIELSKLPDGKMKRFRSGERKILLVNFNENIYASDIMCTHEEVDLSTDGMLTDNGIKCQVHGSVFECGTGKPLNEPATIPLKTYKTDIRDGFIFVEM